MGKVRLEISPSLAGVLNAKGSDWVILEKEIEEGTTIGDIWEDLAFNHIEFREAVFDPGTGKVSDQVMVVLNDSLLQFSNVTEVKLKDGDTVILLPVYSGG